jgi:hypothetical protein
MTKLCTPDRCVLGAHRAPVSNSFSFSFSRCRGNAASSLTCGEAVQGRIRAEEKNARRARREKRERQERRRWDVSAREGKPG